MHLLFSLPVDNGGAPILGYHVYSLVHSDQVHHPTHPLTDPLAVYALYLTQLLIHIEHTRHLTHQINTPLTHLTNHPLTSPLQRCITLTTGGGTELTQVSRTLPVSSKTCYSKTRLPEPSLRGPMRAREGRQRARAGMTARPLFPTNGPSWCRTYSHVLSINSKSCRTIVWAMGRGRMPHRHPSSPLRLPTPCRGT